MKNISKFVSFVLLTSFISCSTTAQQKTDLSVAEFEKGISKTNIQLVDVRTSDEYKTGYIKNAVLADWNNDEQFKEKAAGLDKTKPVYVYCRSGGRSSKAAQWLTENGFKEVYNLEGGILSWEKTGKAVVLSEK